MLPNRDFKVERALLAPGESLLLYTDGVADALNSRNERFSEERLLSTALRSSTSDGTLLSSLVAALDAHMAGFEQYDDITLLTVHRKA